MGRDTKLSFPAGDLGIFPPPTLGNFAKRKTKHWRGGRGEGGDTCAPFGPDLLSSRFRVDFWLEKSSKELCLSMGSPEEKEQCGICREPVERGQEQLPPGVPCLCPPTSRSLHVPEASGISHPGPAGSKGLCWDEIPLRNVGFFLPCPCSGGFAAAPCPHRVPAVCSELRLGLGSRDVTVTVPRITDLSLPWGSGAVTVTVLAIMGV